MAGRSDWLGFSGDSSVRGRNVRGISRIQKAEKNIFLPRVHILSIHLLCLLPVCLLQVWLVESTLSIRSPHCNCVPLSMLLLRSEFSLSRVPLFSWSTDEFAGAGGNQTAEKNTMSRTALLGQSESRKTWENVYAVRLSMV